jgi:hypothetical protein
MRATGTLYRFVQCFVQFRIQTFSQPKFPRNVQATRHVNPVWSFFTHGTIFKQLGHHNTYTRIVSKKIYILSHDINHIFGSIASELFFCFSKFFSILKIKATQTLPQLKQAHFHTCPWTFVSRFREQCTSSFTLSDERHNFFKQETWSVTKTA